MIWYRTWMEPKRETVEISVNLAKQPHLITCVCNLGEGNYRFTVKHWLLIPNRDPATRAGTHDAHVELGGIVAQEILHNLRSFYKAKPDPFDRVGDWEWDSEQDGCDWDKRRRLLYVRMDPKERHEIFGNERP